MINNNRISWYVWTPSSFVNNKVIVGQVQVPAGKRIRAVLSWDGCPGQGLLADFDLHILDPNNNTVMNCASYDGAYEIGEVYPTVAGTYTFEVQRFSWGQCSAGNGYTIYAGFAYDVR